jgi:hypothetical protein
MCRGSPKIGEERSGVEEERELDDPGLGTAEELAGARDDLVDASHRDGRVSEAAVRAPRRQANRAPRPPVTRFGRTR